MTSERTILAVSEDPSFSETALSALAARPSYRVRTSAPGDFARLSTEDIQAIADLVVVSIGGGEWLGQPEFTEGLRRLEIPFIVVSGELSAEGLRRVVQLNAADWLQEPVDPTQLMEAVSAQLGSQNARKSRVASFLPAIGGAGATSLAIMAAASVAKRSKADEAEVCLVDLSFGRAAAGNYLDLTNQEFDVMELARHPERIDLELLDIVKREHPLGFTVLSFHCPELDWSKDASEFIYRLLDNVAFRYPYTIIDLPSHHTAWRPSVVKACDVVAMVTEANVPGLRYCRGLRNELIEAGADPERIEVIVNKYHGGFLSRGLSKDEIRKVFANAEIVFLPEDGKTASEAMNRGLPWQEVNGRSATVKALDAWLGQHLFVRKKRSFWGGRS